MAQTTKKGQCLCGAVKFRSDGPWRPVITCHCNTCRRTSGHFWAATAVPTEALKLTKKAGLAWYDSSDVAKRGFCKHCGSSLFYQHKDKGYIAISGGAIDGATGLEVTEEVFCHEKGDYYPLTAGVPQHDLWSEEWIPGASEGSQG